MIDVVGNTYSVIIYNQYIIYLLDPDRVRVADKNNWIYAMATHPRVSSNNEDDHNYGDFVAGNSIDEDFVPPHPRPT